MAHSETTILIVDDQITIQLVLDRLLERLVPNVQRIIVTDGAGALASLANRTISLIMTNLRLPDMSGVDLAAQIQARWPSIPIILISGIPPAQLADLVIAHGLAGALAKPFGMDELRAVVMPYLRA